MCLGWPTSPSRKPLTSFKNRGGTTVYLLLLLLCFFLSFLLYFFLLFTIYDQKFLHPAMLKLSLKDKDMIHGKGFLQLHQLFCDFFFICRLFLLFLYLLLIVQNLLDLANNTDLQIDANFCLNARFANKIEILVPAWSYAFP